MYSCATNFTNHEPPSSCLGASASHLLDPNQRLVAHQNHFDPNQLQATSSLVRFVQFQLVEPMQSLEGTFDFYATDFWSTSGDERTSKLPLMTHGPWKLIAATLVYLYLTKFLLPELMRSKRALELNWPIRAYNLVMVLCNMWAFYHGARILKFGLRCFGCEIINPKDLSPNTQELLYYGWLFFISRLVEWLDTIFFVLRKKDRQITKLHVFHHSFVPLISWIYLKYHPGYTVAFFPFINTFVHSIMYTYYFLATFGKPIQPYLWWKRYLTSLQIAQFVLILFQLASIPLTGDEQCQYPRAFLYFAFAGAILFLWLFYAYYIETYTSEVEARRITGVDGSAVRDKQRRSEMRHNQLKYSRLAMAREGSSCAVADVIENSISS